MSPTPVDLAVGGFSSDPPWLVDPDHLEWRKGCKELRTRTAAQVPDLLRRGTLPPGRRVIKVGLTLGRAVGGWYFLDRRRARRRGHPEISRAALSRRMR